MKINFAIFRLNPRIFGFYRSVHREALNHEYDQLYFLSLGLKILEYFNSSYCS